MRWRWSSLRVSPTGRLSPIWESPARVCKCGRGKGRLASRGLSHWPAHTRSRRHGHRQGPTADAPPGREKSTCARQRPMERQNSRPQHRPAGGFRLVSQRAVDSPPGWGHRLAQSFTCDRGSQPRTAAFTAMVTTHEPGLFHGSRRRRRPGRSHGNPSFRPRLELIRAFLLTGLDPIDLHNIPPKFHKHRTLQGARVSLSSFRVKAACVSHRQRREPPGTADELVWRQLPSCD